MALLSHMASSLLERSRSAVFTAMIGIICICSGGIVLADDSAGPWECSGYNGDAHTRCLQAFIEVQRETISKLEGELKSQQGSVNQLREQADRQSAATADLQRQLSETSHAAASVPPVQFYSYPPAGVGLYLGSPWYYGSSYFYRPYFGPRVFFGPRYFGPRYFRHCRGRC
ncbi:MAG: hypothetical protein ACREIM_09690 [Nitrospiraceae bacterium]